MYSAFSASVGSRLQASCSHGCMAKIAICTKALGSPCWLLLMYSLTFFATRSVRSQWPNQVALGRSAIFASSVRSRPLAVR